MIQKKAFLVYCLPRVWRGTSSLPPSVEWALAGSESVRHLFRQEEARSRMFNRFLKREMVGIFLFQGNEWIAYAWLSRPRTSGPPHLPRAIRRLPVYWIFYCHTKEAFRGKGFYQQSLILLAGWAREQDAQAAVYIDTEPDNRPSRAAIGAVGFVPQGMVSLYRTHIPRLRHTLWGRWQTQAPHPSEMRS